MARENYQRALADLRSDVYAMGTLVQGRLDDAVESLATGDAALARRIHEGDDDVDELYLDLESQCVDLFALQQPVASDLRFVTASFKITTDLERIGDLATNLGQYARAKRHETDVDLAELGRTASDLLGDSLVAYRDEHADACREIARRDDRLDALCQRAGERVARDLIEREPGNGDAWTAEELLDDASRVLLTVRDLERVGDHAVNIAARTLYAAENDPALL
ncbi:MAG: phosphate signaling complex protein PhoU [Haloarculaceae archaeon]